MKKCALYGLLPVVLVAGATTASANLHERCAFNGFYAGVGTGVNVTTGHARLAETSTFSFPALGIRESFSAFRHAGLKKNAWTGSVFAGYGCAWDCFYLGAEAYYKYARARGHNSEVRNFRGINPTVAVGESYSVKAGLRPNEFGIDLRPGVMLSPRTLLYGRVGVAFNRVSVSFIRSEFTNASPALVTSFQNGGHHRKNSAGLRLGAGMEHEFCNHWALRAEYTWARFQRVHFARTIATTPVGNFTRASAVDTTAARARLSTHTVQLGLAYYW